MFVIYEYQVVLKCLIVMWKSNPIKIQILNELSNVTGKSADKVQYVYKIKFHEDVS